MIDASIRTLVIGFVLTTVLGGLVGSYFQRAAWRRQARLELFRQTYADTTSLFTEAVRIIDTRYYRLLRWRMAIEAGAQPDEIQARVDRYYEVVATWNESLRLIHNGLRINFGEERALSFLSYGDDFRKERPSSIHYRFLRCTELMKVADESQASLEAAVSEMNHLNWTITAFANEAADELRRRAISLSLLRSSYKPLAQDPRLLSGPRHPGEVRDAGV